LKDGETALLVDDYENPVEIANYINQALTNDENVQRIRKNARSVGMKFSKESVDQQEIEIYQKALELTKTKKGDFFERVHLVLQNLL
jgi:glycosyltransferase involved in cell wall biosynthesis